jgi:hypothetical protein
MIECTEAEQIERLNARVVELLGERDQLRDKLASAEQSIREGDGMDYFGQRFDRALDRAEAAERRLASARKALEGCRTSYNGYAITKPEQYTTVLASFWKEIKRIDHIARTALTDENSK